MPFFRTPKPVAPRIQSAPNTMDTSKTKPAVNALLQVCLYLYRLLYTGRMVFTLYYCILYSDIACWCVGTVQLCKSRHRGRLYLCTQFSFTYNVIHVISLLSLYYRNVYFRSRRPRYLDFRCESLLSVTYVVDMACI